MLGYELSEDYTRLQELLDKGYLVVCVVPMKTDGVVRNTVCVAELRNKGQYRFEHYEVRYGGTVVTTYNDYMRDKIKGYPQSFSEQMAARKVSFINFK